MALSGIFDPAPTRSPLAGANLVQIQYCSSDAWVGDISAEDALEMNATQNAAHTLGWAFKGQRIVAAVLDILADEFGFGALPGTDLLFGGCSAGARGAMFTLDYVHEMVRAPPACGHCRPVERPSERRAAAAPRAGAGRGVHPRDAGLADVGGLAADAGRGAGRAAGRRVA